MTVREFKHGRPPGHFASLSDVQSYTRSLWDAFYRARQGKMDCITEITLTAGAATTVFADKRLSPQSVVHFDPKTANAATELYGATMYALTANRGTESWTISHANNGQTDRTFAVSIIG